jgi:DNA-binding MarR family transcriptional regulator
MAEDEEDLGALFARITRRLIDAERPLLDELGLSMWGYIALSHLAHAPAETQLALAQAISYDKTRLIGLLDELEADGLITRTPDPADRRARIISLTTAGTGRHATARRAIRKMEDGVLADVSTAERTRLRRTLARLADV